VRENILKAGIVGRLVANDFSGALISAIVLERDAQGRPVDPIASPSSSSARCAAIAVDGTRASTCRRRPRRSTCT
jgi:hypothetical protein